MLRYLGWGPRRFGKHPMYIHQRANWEFFAVVRGRCGALYPEGGKTILCERRLWVFPPEVIHGWGGKKEEPCHVSVFHFGAAPPLLEKVARERGHLECELTTAEARRIQQLVTELRPHYERMTEKSLLVFESALLALSLLALKDISFDYAETKTGQSLRKVDAVLTWYSEHITEQPKLERVAGAMHLSVRHLRRLFWQARQEKPQQAFTRLRLQRAMELLSKSDIKLDAIAVKCGFSSASDFCRVFKSEHKISPDAWRRRVLPAYREPR